MTDATSVQIEAINREVDRMQMRVHEIRTRLHAEMRERGTTMETSVLDLIRAGDALQQAGDALHFASFESRAVGY